MKQFSPNMTDKELDRLFREASEQFQPSQDTSGWEMLEEKLGPAPVTTKETQSRRKDKHWWVLLLLLIICGGSAWWGINFKKNTKRMLTSSEKISYDTSVTHLHSIDKSINSKAGFAQSQKKGAGSLKNIPATNVQGDNNKAAIKDATDKNTEKPIIRYGITINETQEKNTIEMNNNDKHDNTFKLQSLSGIPFLSSNLSINNTPRLKVRGYHTKSMNVIQENNTDTNFSNKAGNTPEQKTIPAKAQPVYHWSIGLTAGPEWSMVHGKGSASPGVNTGLLFQYHFAKRWYAESGILLASKLYAARPSDYHAWISYPTGLQIVKANCRVTDIPVNIRFDVLQHSDNRFFIGGGLSSYWMKEEDYTFKYQSGEDKYRSIYNQNRHLLSIVNIEMGYEKSWHRFSLQARPVLKIPLQNIGYGKVKLVSAGALFSLQYGF